jgi:hypothetical protein
LHCNPGELDFPILSYHYSVKLLISWNCKLLAHVYYRSESSSFFKSKLFIEKLNKEGHLSLYLLLFFSLCFLMILKSPPTSKGKFSVSHIRASSLKKTSFSLSCAAPYTDNIFHSKLSALLCSLNITPDFKTKTRCSSYVCPGSSCHTYGQNVNTENQCIYYINFATWVLSLQRRLYRLSHRAAAVQSNPTGNRPQTTQASRRNLHRSSPSHLCLLSSVTTRISRLMVATQQV